MFLLGGLGGPHCRYHGDALALDRLVSAAGSYGTLAYTYDANGNRATEINPANTTADGLGSITTLVYNQAGRLSSVSAGSQQITQYTYSSSGSRLIKVGTASATTLFQYDGGRHLLEETDAQGNVKADYIYLGGHPVAEYSVGKLYFLYDDRLGTPQVATDSTQTVAWVGNYQPFGLLSASSQTALLAQDLRLPGQENDTETGLYHNGFRDYVPGWGRYLQSDPSGLAGGLNTFAYVRANPFRLVDRTGLDDDDGSGDDSGSEGSSDDTGTSTAASTDSGATSDTSGTGSSGCSSSSGGSQNAVAPDTGSQATTPVAPDTGSQTTGSQSGGDVPGPGNTITIIPWNDLPPPAAPPPGRTIYHLPRPSCNGDPGRCAVGSGVRG